MLKDATVCLTRPASHRKGSWCNIVSDALAICFECLSNAWDFAHFLCSLDPARKRRKAQGMTWGRGKKLTECSLRAGPSRLPGWDNGDQDVYWLAFLVGTPRDRSQWRECIRFLVIIRNEKKWIHLIPSILLLLDVSRYAWVTLKPGKRELFFYRLCREVSTETNYREVDNPDN